jgi:hypothetical protein
MTEEKQEAIKKRFLKDTENHSINIKKDDKVFRHIVMSRDNSSTYKYEITTWPGYLCFSGDMGCFVFRRLNDMLCFFRSEKLTINKGYWHEKLEAVDRGDGSMKYSEELFEEAIKEYFESFMEENEEEYKDKKEEIWNEIENDVLYFGSNGFEAHKAAGEFECEGFRFNDFWETNLEEYTYRFVWCLYAIVHAIQIYDEIKEVEDVSSIS